jgi:parvulin-like peptidyl-prolyl isomerase
MIIRLLSIAALLSLCSRVIAEEKPGASAEASVLAKAGAHEIHVQDVQATLANLGSREQSAATSDPAVLNQMVRSLLVQRLVLQQALEQKWDQKPETQAYIARLRESAITESFLQGTCAPPESYPSDAELQSTYDAGKAALLVPRSYRLAQIFVAEAKGSTDKMAIAKAEDKLRKIRTQLAASGADFAALASEHSEEKESASRGGEIGWLAENQIQPEILAKLPKMTLNTISEPIRLDDGWHILKVLDAREPYTPTLDQVKADLTRQMRTERTRVNTQAYLAELLRNNPIAVNELALSKLQPNAK